MLLRYGGAGPRYTSDPTALAWSESYDAGCSAEDLAGLAGPASAPRLACMSIDMTAVMCGVPRRHDSRI